MKEWTRGRVNDLIESLESGVSVNGSEDVPTLDKPAVLKVSAVTYGTFDGYFRISQRHKLSIGGTAVFHTAF